ncbi:MAG: flagellar biosynthetic protein FliR [Desulfatiglans sp.]|jgi:flagellar biosynthetic protein FliR|nr:flagellar biosynthetic protein FliR [Thermodesulfobacteriota bacterium]MEE4354457.1 flagellar biosynthetic protein FliR [Desulfatiglans sp.]
MISFNFSLTQIQMFLLAFLRVSAILATVPPLNNKSIPIIFKAGLAFTISMILFPILDLENIPFFIDTLSFGIKVVSEIMLGIMIGLSVRLLFAGIQLAGQLAGYQMGFAIVNVMDTLSSNQVSIIAQFHTITSMLIFFCINAHHWILRALVESFRLVPPFSFHINHSIMDQMMKHGANLFVIAVKLGAPVIVALLLTSVALGLVARTVPQMNVFIVAFPLKIVVGLLFLALSLPYFLSFLKEIFNGIGSNIIMLLKAV